MPRTGNQFARYLHSVLLAHIYARVMIRNSCYTVAFLHLNNHYLYSCDRSMSKVTMRVCALLAVAVIGDAIDTTKHIELDDVFLTRLLLETISLQLDRLLRLWQHEADVGRTSMPMRTHSFDGTEQGRAVKIVQVGVKYSSWGVLTCFRSWGRSLGTSQAFGLMEEFMHVNGQRLLLSCMRLIK